MKVVASFTQREKRGKKNRREWESLESLTVGTGRERTQKKREQENERDCREEQARGDKAESASS